MKVVWNYGNVKDTPEDCLDAIYIEDIEECGAAIGVEDIDTLIEKLIEMKKEWETIDYITELPERFEFNVSSTKQRYTAIDSCDDNERVIVVWEYDNELGAVLYTKEQVLKYVNEKTWTIL